MVDAAPKDVLFDVDWLVGTNFWLWSLFLVWIMGDGEMEEREGMLLTEGGGSNQRRPGFFKRI